MLLKVLRIFKVPQVFVMTLGMCYRYVYLFIEIIQNTFLSIKSRVGFAVQHHKGRELVAWNIASLWQRSYQLNNEVYNAMLSRGYRGEPQVLDESNSGLTDWIMMASALMVFIMVLIMGAKI
jgi:energy-coupling factor transporter transmembrane protein EcfT